jgi:ribosomal protein L33
MAKSKKGPRENIGLECSVCGAFNYITELNKNNELLKKQKDSSYKFTQHKYCKVCRKATTHTVKKKLK